ncbi:type VI secretion system tube protein Hcp [uncultured Roseobacter sp.]|uniref:Hcp family type VI secretion system effector n=1 Tax=uncultured Roseobacter sp. TaxID=114847 RepID=UPI0026173854|nr:type VI secretion system tube protein Hcp [uncultured Roseobacter sp.]
MPLTGYLKIEDIPGESQRAGHEDEIDVWGMQFDVRQMAGQQIGRGRARARADIDPLVVHKAVDASSPYLADAVWRGKAFPEVTLAVARTSGETSLDYLVITMENVTVTACGFGNEQPGGEDETVFERVELEFEKVSLRYTRQNQGGLPDAEHEVELGG